MSMKWAFLLGYFMAAPYLALAAAPKEVAMKGRHEWVLVYYMSYDNNLARYKNVILEALEKGTKGSDLIVTALVDDPERTGLKRYVLSGKGMSIEKLSTDNSADVNVFIAYMEWVRINYPAKHYAVIFLDHGGRLDEMCLDEWPGKEGASWLSARAVADALRNFRRATDGEVEFVFLQQCGRGSVENLYNFRDTATVVMASQENVGAPNTYYEPSLKWLAANKGARGSSLADRIMALDEHYSSYVSVSGKLLSELPDRLEPVIAALLNARTSRLLLPDGLVPSYRFAGERNFDLLEWLGAVFERNAVSPAPLREFEAWVKNDLILKVSVRSARGEGAPLTGLSLFVPVQREPWERYVGYPIYQQSLFKDLWNSLHTGQGKATPAKN